MTQRYEFPVQERRILEELTVPLAVYQFLNGKIVTLLVSDGLIAMQKPGQTREGLAEQFDHDMFRNCNSDDTVEVVRRSKEFALKGGTYRAVYREKLYGKDEWSLVQSQGRHVYTADGTRLAYVFYTDITGILSNNKYPDNLLDKTEKNALSFLNENLGALAVVSRKTHVLHYYTKALCNILPPRRAFDIGRTFNEFFFGSEEKSIPGLFDQADLGLKTVTEPDGYKKFLVNVISTSWENDPSYMIYFYEYEEQEQNSEENRAMEARAQFSRFIQTGISNHLKHWESGYKAFFIWNLTKGTLVRMKNADFISQDMVDKYSYDFHRTWMKKIADVQNDIEAFDKYTSEYFLDRYKTGTYVRSMQFSYHIENGPRMVVRSEFFMAQSPDTGDIYLKVQNENITNEDITRTLLFNITANLFDFIVYIDVPSDSCILLNPEMHMYSFHEMADELSLRLGLSTKDPNDFISFLTQQCGNNNEGVMIRRISSNLTRDIRVKILDKDNGRYYFTCTDIKNLSLSGAGFVDPLTGLASIELILRQADAFLNHIKKKAALLYFDVTGMKAYNGRYGYAQGDALLSLIASIMREAFPYALVSRISEDHFMVLTEDEEIGKKVLKCHKNVLEKGRGAFLKAGVYSFDPKSKKEEISQLIDKARLALENGRKRMDRIIFKYDSATNERYTTRHAIVDSFDEAIRNGYIQVYYQPIVDAITGNIVSWEALCRWIDPKKGILSPVDFIPTLEDYHLITRLDMHMAELVCRDVPVRKAMGFGKLPVSVNFTAIDFETLDLPRELSSLLDRYGLPHEMLAVEITERAASRSPQFIHKQIMLLQELGFKVWMDDFGTGYSNMSSLRDFGFDLVKFDMSLVRNVDKDLKMEKIMSSLSVLFKSLGIRTLAEGVESNEQFLCLRNMGIESLQGYLFAKPRPLDEILSQEKLTYIH